MEQEQRASHWWPTCGVMLGALTVSLTHGVLNVAVPSMMSSLGTDLDRIQWVQTAYQITQAVVMPAVGWLGARLGTKRLFLLSTITFIIGIEVFNWQAIFYINVPVGLISAGIILFTMPKTQDRQARPFD